MTLTGGRMGRRLRSVACLAGLLAAACAPTGGATTGKADLLSYDGQDSNAGFVRRLKLEEYVAEDRRLRTVAHTLLRAGQPLCPDREIGSYGLGAAYLDDFDSGLQGAARNVFGFAGDVARVVYTVDGSPAAAAGLRPGDAILAIRGGRLQSASNMMRRLVSDGAADRPVDLTIERQGQRLEVRLASQAVCDVDIEVSDSTKVNAWADASGIEVSRGMLGFARTEPELATVVAHELSHVLLNHAGSFIGFTSTETLEEEADRAGLYLMAKAGYPPREGVRLLRRMAATFDQINDTASHPTMYRRFLVIEKTLKEIERQQRSGRPLTLDF